MLVVRVELHSAITGKVEELGRVLIANDGTAAARSIGHYDAKAVRKGTTATPHQSWFTGKGVTRQGRVEAHPRLREPVMNLVRKALESMGY